MHTHTQRLNRQVDKPTDLKAYCNQTAQASGVRDSWHEFLQAEGGASAAGSQWEEATDKQQWLSSSPHQNQGELVSLQAFANLAVTDC